jgi:hypothetical protein
MCQACPMVAVCNLQQQSLAGAEIVAGGSVFLVPRQEGATLLDKDQAVWIHCHD